jgi:hypothetical protein
MQYKMNWLPNVQKTGIMKTIISSDKAKKGVVTPWEFTDGEFVQEIRKAEEGKFYPVEEGIKRFKEWKLKRKK